MHTRFSSRKTYMLVCCRTKKVQDQNGREMRCRSAVESLETRMPHPVRYRACYHAVTGAGAWRTYRRRHWPYLVFLRVLTLFFDICQERWFRWRKDRRFKRNQKMYRVGIGRWEPVWWARGIFCEDANPPALVLGRWKSCRLSQGRRRGSGFYENLDDSVVIF